MWFDMIETVAGDDGAGSVFQSNNGATVNVNTGSPAALHLWADPAFRQRYDDEVRARNGALAANLTGTLDTCGWPLMGPSTAPAAQQYERRTTPFFDDFSQGLNPENFVVQYGYRACCSKTISDNLNMQTDVVNGVSKSVLAMVAHNKDSGCPGASCKKTVSSNAAISTTDLFGSGVYEVIAKVPDAPGMTWAVWTFHYEQHLPRDCSQYTCFCGSWGTAGCPADTCMPSSMYVADGCPSLQGCDVPNMCSSPGYEGSPEQTCGKDHTEDDPQWIGSASFTDFIQQTNHEIDIEVPANCMGTGNVCDGADGSCAGDYSTVNLNNYLFTNNNGAGPAYANMCVKVTDSAGAPILFAGDDQYHNYTIVWHSGDDASGDITLAYVDTYIDGIYLGRNNAFVPTRGSRLWISLWPSSAHWNGNSNSWGGGSPGDGKEYSQTVLLSSVRITPFNDPNDVMVPDPTDLPDGCDGFYATKACHKWQPVTISP